VHFPQLPPVCIARLQDSDEEVLVPLEDVLVPHPEDFLNAETLGLTSQVRWTPLLEATSW
jgi:hypothetical protein